MPDEYVKSKIVEALAASNNDKHDAQKLLITWAVRDQSLLLGMAKPHLKAVAAALIDHAVRSKDGKPDTGPDNFSKSTIEKVVAGSPRDRRSPRHVPPPKETERQATVMRKLAAAFTKKKK